MIFGHEFKYRRFQNHWREKIRISGGPLGVGKAAKWAKILENQLYSNNQRCSGGLVNGELKRLSSSIRP